VIDRGVAIFYHETKLMRFFISTSKVRPILSLLLACVLVCLPSLGQSQENATSPQLISDPYKAIRDQLAVTWYRPDYTKRAKDGRKGVVVSGKTKPGARILLGGKRITKYTDEKSVEFIEVTKERVENLPASADQFGLFYFELYLDEGNYQIPVVVMDPKVKKSQAVNRYQLSFRVEKDRIRLADDSAQENLAFSPFLKKANRVSVGYGANFLKYGKVTPELGRDVNFASVKGPALFVDYWHRFNPRWELALSYKVAPGATTSSEEIPVLDGDYSWDIGTLDFMYFPERLFIERPNSYRLRMGLRLGFQHHQVPFLRSVEFGELDQEMITNPITMMAVGFQAEYERSPEWKYEVFMRYQHPLSVGSSFEMTPEIMFDGSLGAQYNFPGYVWALGAFWYGQMQNAKFTEFDEAEQAKVAGSYKLFYSNFEMRLMYNF
jgi:hypothetical protein